MKAQALRQELVRELLRFAWDQWAQLGVFAAPPEPPEQRAADPEALLLFTLELAREDPRLFDEVLDWLAAHEAVVSVLRLRRLCANDEDRALVGAALATASRRSAAREALEAPTGDARLLFRDLGEPRRDPDATFLRFGLLREPFVRGHRSRDVPFRMPAAFALRLRRLFGVGVRAEILRALLTIRAPRVSGRVLALESGFAPRNARETLLHLQEAGIVGESEFAGERYYNVDVEDWALVLQFDHPAGLPLHFDWIPALRAVTRILRWLEQPGLDALSPYLRASGARTLVHEIAPDLDRAGAPPRLGTAIGEAYWDDFVLIAKQASQHVRASS